MKNIIKFATIALFTAVFAVSCDLPEYSHDEYLAPQAFSEINIQSSLQTLYGNLPKVGSIYSSEAGVSDYFQSESDSKYLSSYSSLNCGTWSGWTNIRTINMFISNVENPEICTIDNNLKPQYIAMGRFFRAMVYFNLLTKYGDLPWYSKPIEYTDHDNMFKSRESRDLIVKNIIEDLDYAALNIKNVSPDKSTPDKWCAYFLKSRVCLFEASYRKYHNLTKSEVTGETFTNYTVNQLYTLAAQAAKAIIDGGEFSLNTAAGTKGAYRDLFYSDALLQNEVLLGAVTAPGSDIQGSQNQTFNQPAASKSLARPFINLFLMQDGTAFTDQTDFDLKSFEEEFKGRDLRLAQIVRGPKYQMITKVGGKDMVNAVADIRSKAAPLGYQVIKFTLDKTLKESEKDGKLNTNSTPYYRYAEVLLNYAEAKAELGEMTNEIWGSTIGALRSRAGITGGLDAVPTNVDAYMKATFFPDVTNAAIMEIRRERTIELCLEGLREMDLMRWKAGKNIADLPWKGLHIEALDKAIDINGDGTDDYYFATADPKNDYSSIWVEIKTSGEGLYATVNAKGGFDLEYKLSESKRYFDDSRYLYAISTEEINKYKASGYVLQQNPGY